MMKKRIGLLSLFVLIIVSCTKVNTSPSSLSGRVWGATATSTSHVPLNHIDSTLLGNWILDSSWHYTLEGYNNSFAMLTDVKHYSDPFNCHLLLTSGFVINNIDHNSWKAATNGLSCTNSQEIWRVADGYLTLSVGNYKMISYSSTKLVLYIINKYAFGGCQTGKSATYYLHK
jgi:hypothetical protein